MKIYTRAECTKLGPDSKPCDLYSKPPEEDDLEKSFREDYVPPKLKKGNPALVIPRKVAPVDTVTTQPEELGQKYLTCYHVTPTRNVDSIKQSGLIPRYGKPTQGENPAYNAVYFHTDARNAQGFSTGEPQTTLTVRIPINGDTAKRLAPDEDTFHRSAAEAIKMGDGIAYRGTIPPDWIA